MYAPDSDNEGGSRIEFVDYHYSGAGMLFDRISQAIHLPLASLV